MQKNTHITHWIEKENQAQVFKEFRKQISYAEHLHILLLCYYSPPPHNIINIKYPDLTSYIQDPIFYHEQTFYCFL